MKLSSKEIYLENDVFWWESLYGTDTLCPAGHPFEGLPYWVEYMPHHLQQEYVNQVDKKEFVPYER